MSKPFFTISDNPGYVGLNTTVYSDHNDFCNEISKLLKHENNHCVNYYSIKNEDNIELICIIADDTEKTLRIYISNVFQRDKPLCSLTLSSPQMHVFEREIHENHGISFKGHPWLKPLRYSCNRFDRNGKMSEYPFYLIDSEELHEVGVGPVHAGVIEPGHFRFICNGEKVLHLEIQLGYQHRGIEKLITVSENALKRSILSESIAGDSVAAHSLSHVQLMESLSGIDVPEKLQIERCIALEMERIAIHIGDTAALCGDVAYQLGQVVCEALRTMVINTTQLWCGNRFGKGLIRPGGTNYPLDNEILDSILKTLGEVESRFSEVSGRIYSLPTVLARFEDVGQVTRDQALSIGAVGMAARTCGIPRDIRVTHPFQYYRKYNAATITLDSGDVLARGLLRVKEVVSSFRIITGLADAWRNTGGRPGRPVYDYSPRPDSFSVSLVEGWRGEICHSAFTGSSGEIVHYKVKDPSLHNWMALALAVRNQEISDFPVCNKSFNLSYCGHDL
ncbi:MAG: NADH-quinone oxidoreductase subunit C [Bacteroidales bacterium]|jgi:Ni,Fe-hydrogenase III large subunit|nr:NADH-quinone oxidoreductase subunit C [Bacteroidales bacterium]